MTLLPLDDRVIVEIAAADTHKGSIAIPDTAQQRPAHGTVIAVGPGRPLDNGTRATPNVKTGDTILYPQYSGADVQVDGKDYKIFRESDILAVVEEA